MSLAKFRIRPISVCEINVNVAAFDRQLEAMRRRLMGDVGEQSEKAIKNLARLQKIGERLGELKSEIGVGQHQSAAGAEKVAAELRSMASACDDIAAAAKLIK